MDKSDNHSVPQYSRVTDKQLQFVLQLITANNIPASVLLGVLQYLEPVYAFRFFPLVGALQRLFFDPEVAIVSKLRLLHYYPYLLQKPFWTAFNLVDLHPTLKLKMATQYLATVANFNPNTHLLTDYLRNKSINTSMTEQQQIVRTWGYFPPQESSSSCYEEETTLQRSDYATHFYKFGKEEQWDIVHNLLSPETRGDLAKLYGKTSDKSLKQIILHAIRDHINESNLSQDEIVVFLQQMNSLAVIPLLKSSYQSLGYYVIFMHGFIETIKNITVPIKQFIKSLSKEILEELINHYALSFALSNSNRLALALFCYAELKARNAHYIHDKFIKNMIYRVSALSEYKPLLVALMPYFVEKLTLEDQQALFAALEQSLAKKKDSPAFAALLQQSFAFFAHPIRVQIKMLIFKHFELQSAVWHRQALPSFFMFSQPLEHKIASLLAGGSVSAILALPTKETSLLKNLEQLSQSLQLKEDYEYPYTLETVTVKNVRDSIEPVIKKLSEQSQTYSSRKKHNFGYQLMQRLIWINAYPLRQLLEAVYHCSLATLEDVDAFFMQISRGLASAFPDDWQLGHNNQPIVIIPQDQADIVDAYFGEQGLILTLLEKETLPRADMFFASKELNVVKNLILLKKEASSSSLEAMQDRIATIKNSLANNSPLHHALQQFLYACRHCIADHAIDFPKNKNDQQVHALDRFGGLPQIE